MDKSKVAILSVVVLGGAIVVRSWGERNEAPIPVAADVQKPTAPPPAPEPAAAPAAPANADNQSDETAGKTVDVSQVGTSPKDMSSPYLGAKDAPVLVNIFSDFQCPVCKRSADPVKQLVADFPGKVKVIYRNNALPMHGRSKPAALAAWAAKKQGRFWEYHDKLFGSGGQLDDSSLENYAQELGLDVAQWKKDFTDPKNAERVDEEAKWATELGAAGTPSFFVNGKRAVGWGSYFGLKSLVQHEVENSGKNGTSPKDRIVAMASKNTKDDAKEPAIDPQAWAKILTHD